MIKLLIPEDIPSHNKGEAALFYGMLESLQCLGPVEVNLFSLNPDEDTANYKNAANIIDSRGVTPGHMLDGLGSKRQKVVNYAVFVLKYIAFLVLYLTLGKFTTKIMRRELWKTYTQADLVLMSHDSFYAPFYHGPLILFFKILKKPTVLYAATIIPPNPYQSKFKIRITNWFNRCFLKRASLITLREELSFDYLQGLGVLASGVAVYLYPDLAFILKPESETEVDRILEIEGLPRDERLVGIAISQRKLEFAYPDILSLTERSKRSLAAITKMVDFINGVLKATAVFVPHSIGPTSKVDDRVTADWIYEKAANKDKIYIIRNEYNPMQLKGLAGRMDMTVGTRLHFAIDAASMGVPSILITHKEDFRCHGIVGGMLEQREYVYNIETVDEESLIAMVKALWEEREQIKEQLRTKIPNLAQQTYQHGLSVKKMYEKCSK